MALRTPSAAPALPHRALAAAVDFETVPVSLRTSARKRFIANTAHTVGAVQIRRLSRGAAAYTLMGACRAQIHKISTGFAPHKSCFASCDQLRIFLSPTAAWCFAHGARLAAGTALARFTCVGERHRPGLRRFALTFSFADTVHEKGAITFDAKNVVG